MLNDAKAWFKG
jgi:hypothetical protein